MASPPPPMDPAKKAQMQRVADCLGETAGAMYYSKNGLDNLPGLLPADPSPSDVVYGHIHNLRLLDSNPRLNLASYVTTWMEEPARKLMNESLNINHVDGTIYTSSTLIETKCVSIMADLYHVPDPKDVCGCATAGSTEAALLGGLNMRKLWKSKRKEKGLDFTNPNMIICDHYQICWKKFAAYFDVELRLGHVKEGCYTLDPADVERLADENTIGVVAVLGSTYTGHFDDIKAIDAVCDKLRTEKGLDLMIHVDAASGGMIAPFLMPDLEWDFRLKNVISINCSGHKYGLVFCGIGWQIWRSHAHLHPDMVFHLDYLGAQQTNYTLNFSRPASHIVASYYQFLRLGRAGFHLVVSNMEQVAIHLANGLKALGAFTLLNDPRETVPMVAFGLKPYEDGSLRGYTLFEFSDKMKQHGWSIPAYKMPKDLEEWTVCRCVVREDFSLALADQLVLDMKAALEWLETHFGQRSREERDMALERVQSVIAPSRLKEKGKIHPVC